MNAILNLSTGQAFRSDLLIGNSRRTVRSPSGYPSCKATFTTFTADASTATRRRNSSSSLYEVLNVKKTASLPEIKSAYRNLAKMYHPDACQSDGRDFIEIRKAYATLSDPSARAIYDLSLETKRRKSYVGVQMQSRVYTTRSWETDQCW